jgi:hypothetical protein
VEKNIRRQLTLYLNKADAVEIESMRKKFNPGQQHLIGCHVTLCREDEIANIDRVLGNLQNLDASTIAIQFGTITRFAREKGVLLPASGANEEFHLLREKVLKISNNHRHLHEPHITLLHPRNSTCTDEIFREIQSVNLPTHLTFDTISVIEQIDEGQWQVMKTFKLNQRSA